MLVFLMVFTACKSTKSTIQDVRYSEKLSVYRPQQADTTTVQQEEKVTEIQPAVELTGHISAELDSVIAIIVAKNEDREFWDGYTIQLYNGLDRNMAYEVRNQIQGLGLDLPVRIDYHQPNYKVKVGLYFEQLLAYVDYRLLKEDFSSALLLPEKIKLSDYVGTDR